MLESVLAQADASVPPAASLLLNATNRTPVQIQGVVTFIDENRRLIALQERSNAVALTLDLADFHFRLGDRVELEGRLTPLIPACPRYPDNPDGVQIRELFEAPSDWNDYFLSRLRGILHPPVSGDYTFWIASDDSSELWLSDCEDPVRSRKIAQVGNGNWTPPRAWTKSVSQQSVRIPLEAGRSYYLEALGQDTRGKDCLAVAWQGPGFDRTVIDSKFISMPSVEDDKLQSPLPEHGVVWEYWTNFVATDFSVLKITNTFVQRCSAVRILKSENAELPAPLEIQLGRQIDSNAAFRRVNIEGYVSFLSEANGETLLNIVHGSSRIVARMKSEKFPEAVIPRGSLVHVCGVLEPAGDSAVGALSGTLWMQERGDIVWADTDENWESIDPITHSESSVPNPALAAGRVVRAEGRLIEMREPGLWQVQGKDLFQGYSSKDGTNWTPLGSPIEVQMKDSVVVGIAVASPDTDEPVIATFDQITGIPTLASGMNIGDGPTNSRFAGKFRAEGGKLQLQGKGHHIWSRSDVCYFVCQPAKGNLEVSAHLVDLETPDPLGKAALMIRESLFNDSPTVSVVLMNSNRISVHSRWEIAGSTTGGILSRAPSENWIKLLRRKNTFLIRTHDDSLQSGQLVDVLGELEWQGENMVLAKARTRQLPKTSEPRSEVPIPVSSQDEIRTVTVAELKNEAREAKKLAHRVPLRIRGITTFNAHMNGEWFSFVQDETGSVRVRWKTEELPFNLSVGDRVELTGTARSSESQVSEFDANGVTRVGAGEMPVEVPATSIDPRTSKANGTWGELEGVVRSTVHSNAFLIQSAMGLFEVRSGSRLLSLTNSVDALVRIRGVLWRSQDPQILLPDESYAEILEAPPSDPFSMPTFPILSLQTNDGRSRLTRRLKVTGTVTYQQDHFLMVQDETGGIRVESSAGSAFKVGDSVSAVGFSELRGEGLILTDSLLARAARGKQIEPIHVAFDTAVPPQYNGRLVTIEATLLAQHSDNDAQTLDVQSGQRAFRASLPVRNGGIGFIAMGSRLRLSGVAIVNGGESHSTAESLLKDGALVGSLELLLRNPADVIVVGRPPWWNWKYTATTVGLTLVVFVGAVIWIRTLRKRVEARTQELRETMARLQKETRISATLAERDRLAGEIHDSIEQGLSAIMMQMDTAAKFTHDSDEVKKHLITAKNMAGFSRTEVQHAVWDMQSPLLENSDLPTALQRVAQDLQSGDAPRLSVEISGKAFSLTPAVEHHLLRIAQEAITNALKHSSPKTIVVALSYDSDRVVLKVQDDGKGFVPENVSSNGDHFGLQGMNSRARKMEAELMVESVPGKGTMIQIVVMQTQPGALSPTSNGIQL